jgi:hypothetical protein
MKTHLAITALLVTALWFGADAPQALAGPSNICSVSSIDLNPNPVFDGATETITGKVVESGSAGSGCVAGTADAAITDGTITIQENMAGSIGVSCSTTNACTAGNIGAACTTNTSCDSSLGAGDGVCTAANFVDLASGSPPDGNGEFSTTAFNTTGLAGKMIGFRSHYTGGNSGFKESKSLCEDLSILADPVCTPGATIASTLASGDGTPTPDKNNSTPDGPWTFRITVTACGDLTGVTAQGGGNGWAALWPTNAAGLDPDTGSASIRKLNKKTPVIFWNIGDMTDGQVANLDVTVNGNISKSAPCGEIRTISGPWSTLFSLDSGATFDKSSYTGQVTLTVDNDGISTTCNP